MGFLSIRSKSFRKLRNRKAERPRDSLDIAEGYVALAPLDSANVGSIEAALVGKGFLRNPLCPTQFADTLAEAFKDAGGTHIVSLFVLHTSSPHTMSYNGRDSDYRPMQVATPPSCTRRGTGLTYT